MEAKKRKNWDTTRETEHPAFWKESMARQMEDPEMQTAEHTGSDASLQ